MKRNAGLRDSGYGGRNGQDGSEVTMWLPGPADGPRQAVQGVKGAFDKQQSV